MSRDPLGDYHRDNTRDDQSCGQRIPEHSGAHCDHAGDLDDRGKMAAHPSEKGHGQSSQSSQSFRHSPSHSHRTSQGQTSRGGVTAGPCPKAIVSYRLIPSTRVCLGCSALDEDPCRRALNKSCTAFRCGFPCPNNKRIATKSRDAPLLIHGNLHEYRMPSPGRTPLVARNSSPIVGNALSAASIEGNSSPRKPSTIRRITCLRPSP